MHARFDVEAPAKLDHLRVHGRARIADSLGVPLPELAVAAGLRAVVAEHRTEHRVSFTGCGQRLHAVLDERPHDAGRGLGPERPRLRLLGPRREPEQLLLDHVGRLADAALEDGRLLEERDLHLAIAVPGRERAGDPLEPAQADADVGQQVTCSPGGAE